MNSENLIILIGQRVRSGTNFIGSTLSRHPEIQTVPKGISHGEFNLFHEKKILNTFNDVLNKSFGLRKRRIDQNLFLRQYGQLWLDLLSDHYELDKAKKIFIKSPMIQNYRLWYEAFPNAKFIFLARDGRDNVISSVKASNDKRKSHDLNKKLKKRINFYTGRSFIEQIKSWKKTAIIFEEIKENQQVKKIKYLEMIDNYNNLRALLEFCGLKYSEDIVNSCLDAPVVGSSFGISKRGTSKPNWEPAYDKSKFQFKNKWQKWGFIKKEIFKSIAGHELINLGFEQNNNW